MIARKNRIFDRRHIADRNPTYVSLRHQNSAGVGNVLKELLLAVLQDQHCV